MPGSEDPVQYPTIFESFAEDSRREGWADSPELQEIVEFLDDDTGHPDPFDVLEDLCRGYMSDDDLAHFRRHWLGRDDPQYAYWDSEGCAIVAHLLRRGMSRICKRFQATSKPCNYRWLLPGSDEFSLTINEDAHQILFLLTTPIPAYSNDSNAKVRPVANERALLFTASPTKNGVEVTERTMPRTVTK